MNSRTKIKVFKPGDIIYLSSDVMGCSCLTEIVSVDTSIDVYRVKCISYHCGMGFGKTFERGCTTISIDDGCAKGACELSPQFHEFLKLFHKRRF